MGTSVEFVRTVASGIGFESMRSRGSRSSRHLSELGITVYHGTWRVDLSEVVPDPRGEKKMSALGTWFTSNPSRAKDYGPNIYEIELPDDARFLSARTENFERFWFNYELAL